MYSQATVSAVLVVTDDWLTLLNGIGPLFNLVASPEAQPLSQQRERCSARRRSHTRTLVDGADLPNWWGLCSAAAA